MMRFLRPRLSHVLSVGRLEPALLCVGALLLRAWRLARNPLWLDELSSFQIGRQSLPAILRNSLYETHPPLFYLLESFASRLAPYAEWGWRWLSVAASGLTLALLFRLVAQSGKRLSAWLIAVLLLISPSLMYWSQEARSCSVAMPIVAVSLALMPILLDRNSVRLWHWLAWALLTVAGLYSTYSYVMIWIIQALFSVAQWRFHRRVLLICAGTGASLLPLAPAAAGVLASNAARASSQSPLTATYLAQAVLAWEPGRYGLAWGTFWLPAMLIGLAVLGLWQLDRRWGSPAGYYVAAQVLIPLILYFALAQPLFGLKMQPLEYRLFFVLLPAFALLVSWGLCQLSATLAPRLAYPLLAVLMAVMLSASVTGLARYWSITKSPEGTVAKAVRAQMGEEDAIVSLHYSLDSASVFYLADREVYGKPMLTPDGYRFSKSLSILQGPRVIERDTTLDSIRLHPRIWVLYDKRAPATAVLDALTRGCAIGEQVDFAPFAVIRMEACSSM